MYNVKMLNFSKISVMVISNLQLYLVLHAKLQMDQEPHMGSTCGPMPEVAVNKQSDSLESSKMRRLWKPLTRFLDLNIKTFISLAYTVV